jgi:T-complex protein 1 subunit beta
MPTILADNGGYDSADLVSKLRAAHYEGQSDAGLGTHFETFWRCGPNTRFIDMDAGAVGSMRKLGITESYKLKRQVVVSASEAAEMIIRYARDMRRHAHMLILLAESTTFCVRHREDEKVNRWDTVSL